MQKNTLIEALNKVKKDIGPQDNTRLDKKILVDELKTTTSILKPDGKGKLLDDMQKKINTDLAHPEKEIKFEAEWKPARTSTKDIYRRILVEADIEGRKPNAFRMNLMPIVLDKTHAKMTAIRGDKKAIVEILYPNTNEKITIKVQVDGAEDNLVEVGLEDEAYTQGMGAYIIKLVDESLASSGVENQEAFDDYMFGVGDMESAPGANLGKGSFSPNWEGLRESDTTKMKTLMSMVEGIKPKIDAAPEPSDDDSGDIDVEDLGGEGDDTNLDDLDELGDLDNTGEDFSEGDFAVDAGADTDMGDFDSEFGGDFGGGGAAGGEGGEGGEADPNAEDGGYGADDVEYFTFRDKADWLNSSIDAMQKLVSTSVADKMQEGSGVIMTSDEILNGTSGIKGDTNFDIIDKFLKIYPELDEIDLTEEQLEQIDEKLSLDDGQFDAWLQQKLPEFTEAGTEEVSSALDNEMFEDFPEEGMGGEAKSEYEDTDFDDFLDQAEELTDEETSEYKEAEQDVGEPELSEFPEVDEKVSEEEVVKEPKEVKKK